MQKEMDAGTLITYARLPDDRNSRAKGDLTFLDNAVQEGTGTIRSRATLADAARHFGRGNRRVRLVTRTEKRGADPSEAAQAQSEGNLCLCGEG